MCSPLTWSLIINLYYVNTFFPYVWMKSFPSGFFQRHAFILWREMGQDHIQFAGTAYSVDLACTQNQDGVSFLDQVWVSLCLQIRNDYHWTSGKRQKKKKLFSFWTELNFSSPKCVMTYFIAFFYYYYYTRSNNTQLGFHFMALERWLWMLPQKKWD